MARKSPKKSTHKPVHWFTLSLIVSLLGLNVCAAFGVIYTKHLSRQYFSELQALQNQQDQLHVEWSQLLLEQGTWSTDVRVERVAKEHLHMVMPDPSEVKVFR